MDGLSIVTGISMMVFLLFYLAFNIKESGKIWLIVKGGIIIFGLFLLSYIPATTIILDRDCAVLNDGSYRCFQSDGTQVSDFGVATTQIGSGFSVAYLNFLYVIFAGVALALVWVTITSLFEWWKGRKLIK